MIAVIRVILLTLTLQAIVGAEETWKVVTGKIHEGDLAVHVALSDLREIGATFDLVFEGVPDTKGIPEGNCILLGSAANNKATQMLAEGGLQLPQAPENPEGYAIHTVERHDARLLIVAGASVAADVYGLYWILDRLRVNHFIPHINTRREPIVSVRAGLPRGRFTPKEHSEALMRTALRYTFNWFSGSNALDLIPWPAEPEMTENAAHREEERELIRYAHDLHMKYYVVSHDLTCHPVLLEKFNASLNPCDPTFREVVQEKYRLLFQGLPELDAVHILTDDITGFWDPYVPFEFARDVAECEWSYVKRFHEWVAAVYEVVVEECDKVYFQRTWGLREYEVHCQPDVFRAIFTDDIPTSDKFFLIPKITRADRWWFQPYNATFNQSPHNTIVHFERMNCYEDPASYLFPTFSGDYYQSGLQYVTDPIDNNVRGMTAVSGSSWDDWGTEAAYSYVIFRLMWERDVNMEEVARDFCAIHFGAEAAEILAAAYLRSAGAYKYGIHVEPISYGQFNSALTTRENVFVAEGLPAIDNGKGHLDFLRTLYRRCKPWKMETLQSLEQGLDGARFIRERVEEAGPLMQDKELAAALSNRAAMTFGLIHTNKLYMETMFAFFDYWDSGCEKDRHTLEEVLTAFDLACNAFASTPNFSYQLDGVNILRQNGHRLLEDREEAKRRQETTPSEKDLGGIIAQLQHRYEEVLQERAAELIQLGSFEIMIDGQDMLEIKGDSFKLIPIKWDAGSMHRAELTSPLPKQQGTVIPKDLESRAMHPFVLEQPAPHNDFTVRIYLNDLPGGQALMKFDLYFLPDSPEQLGLDVPWGGDHF